MPQVSYERKSRINGRAASGNRPECIESYTNALLAQESDIVVADFDAGTYTVRLSNVDGRVIDISAVTGVSIAAVVAALETAADALVTDLEDSLANVAIVTDASPNLEIRFIHPGEAWSISFPSNPGGNMSHTLVQAAGGTDIALGKFVVRVTGAADECKAPVTGSADADFIGITVANTEALVIDYSTGEPVFEPADTCSVMTQGVIEATVEDAVIYGGPVYARKTINAAGQALGSPRSDADGGDAVLVTGCKFYSDNSAAEVALIKINRP
jgi:hypothetical protein